MLKRPVRIFALLCVIWIFVAIAAVIVLGCLVPSMAFNSRLFDTKGMPAPFIAAMFVGCAAAVWFLIELFFVMLSVKREDPFVKRNVRALKSMAVCCIAAAAALLSLLFIYGWYEHFSIAVCIFILLFGALSAYVLSGVFSRAVEYKDDSDLTV